jgi:hypothetical protein
MAEWLRIAEAAATEAMGIYRRLKHPKLAHAIGSLGTVYHSRWVLSVYHSRWVLPVYHSR